MIPTAATTLVEPTTTGTAPPPAARNAPTAALAPAGFRSLPALLAAQARRAPDRTVLTALDRDGRVADERTAGRLDADARSLAVALLAVAEPGDRVLVPAMPGLGFHRAFLGCLYAGLVAVPVPPIKLGGLAQGDPRGGRRLGRLIAICADAAPVAALVAADQRAPLAAVLDAAAAEHSGLARLRLLPVDSPAESADADLTPAGGAGLPGLGVVDPATPAFLQYTSGSTSAPRGVVVSHGAMIANQRLVSERYALGPRTTVVSWLPLYHDMGLCAGLLQPLYAGGDAVVMEPETFLVRPHRWLEALSHREDAISAAPDFAYQLAIARLTPEVRDRLDLSGWRMALCGAEPVRPDTVRMVASALADCGLRAEALTPAYGLAESTLFVTGGDVDEPAFVARYDREALGLGVARRTVDAGGVELVGAGRPQAGVRVAVVDPETSLPCADRTVGELWVRSPSNGDGYWGRPEESRELFEARLATDPDQAWLRTGDLGFVDDGELVVTGRLKDLVIIRGVNYYPQDFERLVQSAHPALALGLAAAFADEQSPDRVRVVVEGDPRTTLAELANAAADAGRLVTAELPVALEVVVVDRGRVPRTTSGKVRRAECAARFAAGMDVLARWPRHD